MIKIIQLQKQGVLQKGDTIEVGENATAYTVCNLISPTRIQARSHLTGKMYSIYMRVALGSVTEGSYVW